MDEIDIEATERYYQNSNTIDIEATKQYYQEPLSLAQARVPDLIDTGMIIGLEVVPAIVGGLVGSFAGPKGTIIGGAGGSALGNYMSQNYRINRGFQEDLGMAELGAATVLGGIPSATGAKALKNIGGVTRTGIRATEGAGLATGELLARTYGDEGRAPTREEIATTVLFGGSFGGGLGALEAKW